MVSSYGVLILGLYTEESRMQLPNAQLHDTEYPDYTDGLSPS